METGTTENMALLCGTLDGTIAFSHMSRGKCFYTFPLRVPRLSGTDDILNVICSEELLSSLEPNGSPMLRIDGELRSYNNKSGVGNRLAIFVYALSAAFCADEPRNSVVLGGTLCKAPGVRVTPMGREICDLLVAVNRPSGHSDYLPCIAWGQNARRASLLCVGDRLLLTGRVQSRSYIKNVDGEPERRTAFEVSVSSIEKTGTEAESR